MAQGEFIVMDVTVQGDLSTDSRPGQDTGGGGSNQSSDPTKKPTFAEKLMGVRNSQCDLHLQRAQTAIQGRENRSMERIREDTNRVKYDFKEMEVERKKRELEVKKKRRPLVDTEEDEFELARVQRYLFYNPNQCFYTDTKNYIPLRGTPKSDPYQVTPTISRARKILQDMVTERSIEAMQEKRATMVSRKSGARSVRFQSRDNNDGENQSPSRLLKPRPKSMKQLRATPSATSMYQENTDGVGLSKTEQLLAYLRRSKAQTTKFDTLITREPGDDVPDDFTQCQLTPSALQATPILSRNNGDYIQQFHPAISDTVDGVSMHALPTKPNSGYSRRSHALSYNDEVLHLPSISGENISQAVGDNTESVHFGTSEELPPHEVALLRHANHPLPPNESRPVKSAIIQRANTKMSAANRRYTSTSAHSTIKRRQMTHAMLRKEKEEVEIKVEDFLSRFENGKRKAPTQRSSVVVLKTPNGKNDMDNKIIDATNTNKHQNSKAGGVQWQTPATTVNTTKTEEAVQNSPRPKNPRGIPHHSQDRSRRHTATFKLRRMVEELMKNRSTVQLMAYEKMKAARAAGAKTPDPYAEDFMDRSSPALSD